MPEHILKVNNTSPDSSGNVTIAVGDAQTANPLSQFAATTSAQLAGVISNETGSGSLVFSSSPALTGTPTAPTATPGTNTTQLATTAFVNASVGFGIPYGLTTNSGMTFSVTTSPTVTSVTTGTTVDVTFNTAATGNATLNVGGTGDINISVSQTALATTGDFGTTKVYNLTYNGSKWILNNPGINTSGGGDPIYKNNSILTGTPTAPTAALGTNTTQLATLASIQQEKTLLPIYTTSTISGVDLAITPSPALTSYTQGTTFWIKMHTNSGSGSTINVSGLGTISLRKGLLAVSNQDLAINGIYQIVYNSTTPCFQVINYGATSPTGSGGVVLSSSPVISSPQLITPSLGVATATSITATGNINAGGGYFGAGSKPTGSYTVLANDYVVSADNGASNVTVTLPTASGNTGRIFIIKRYDNTSLGIVTVQAASGNVQSCTTGIFGSTTTLSLWGNAGQSLQVRSNGTDWECLN